MRHPISPSTIAIPSLVAAVVLTLVASDRRSLADEALAVPIEVYATVHEFKAGIPASLCDNPGYLECSEMTPANCVRYVGYAVNNCRHNAEPRFDELAAGYASGDETPFRVYATELLECVILMHLRVASRLECAKAVAP